MKVVRVNFAEKRKPPVKQVAPAVVHEFPRSKTFVVRQARNFFATSNGK